LSLKFGVNTGGDANIGCFEIKLRTCAAKFTKIRIGRFRQNRDLIIEREVFIKQAYEAKHYMESGRC